MFAALAAVLLFAVFASAGEGEVLTGHVSRIVDGDTLELKANDGDLVSIRLAQIDAPEASQPYGGESSAALSGLALGKRLRVVVVDRDRYGRTVGEVFADGVHLNTEMVRAGHAWAYPKYAKTAEIIDLEAEARREQRGLWKLPLAQREAPWVWRHRGRDTNKASANFEVADRACGTKRTCDEMRNCDEARFYLLECHVRGLDRDRDGIPCEPKCPP